MTMAAAESIQTENDVSVSWMGQSSPYKCPCVLPKFKSCREHPNTDPATRGLSLSAFLISVPSIPQPSVDVRCQASSVAESSQSEAVCE
jgi:hypothetical protein